VTRFDRRKKDKPADLADMQARKAAYNVNTRVQSVHGCCVGCLLAQIGSTSAASSGTVSKHMARSASSNAGGRNQTGSTLPRRAAEKKRERLPQDQDQNHNHCPSWSWTAGYYHYHYHCGCHDRWMAFDIACQDITVSLNLFTKVQSRSSLGKCLLETRIQV